VPRQIHQDVTVPEPIGARLRHQQKNTSAEESKLSQTRLNILTKAIVIVLVAILLSTPLYPLFSWTQGGECRWETLGDDYGVADWMDCHTWRGAASMYVS
jgi:hypothetical protein